MLPINLAVCDTETTGIDPKTCKVVEIALFNPSVNIEYCSLVDPEIAIPPEVSAIHHICDDDVKGWATWPVVRNDFLQIMAANNITILAAHNADYDKAV